MVPLRRLPAQAQGDTRRYFGLMTTSEGPRPTLWFDWYVDVVTVGYGW
jgi:hypothetical protein